MKLKNQSAKINPKDWKFWFKLLVGIIVLVMVLAVYLKDMIELGEFKTEVLNWFNNSFDHNLSVDEFQKQLNDQFGTNPRLNWISVVPLVIDTAGKLSVESIQISAGFGEYTIYIFSFFTILSNLAVGVWFIVAALNPHKEGKKGFVGYQSTLVVATTITITMLIWLAMLMPTKVASGDEINWYYWFTGLSQHAVFPLLLILYVCLFWKTDQVWSQKEYMKNGWWKLIVVLLIYGIYILVRGEMRYQGGRPYETQYPYFFLRVHETKVVGMPGYAWFIIALSAIIGICLGFSIGYNAILNQKYGKKTNQATKKRN